MVTAEQRVALERQAFLHGDCWVLALALRRMFGFRLVFAVYWPDDNEPTPFEEWSWDHVLVETHAGHPLDVEGRPALDSRWRIAPEYCVRGFWITDDTDEIRSLLDEQIDDQFRPLPCARHYSTDPLPTIIRLAWQWPEAFRVMPLATLDDLPMRLRSRAFSEHGKQIGPEEVQVQ